MTIFWPIIRPRHAGVTYIIVQFVREGDVTVRGGEGQLAICSIKGLPCDLPGGGLNEVSQ